MHSIIFTITYIKITDSKMFQSIQDHHQVVVFVVLQINPTRCTILLSIFISLLYMFRATMCPSSGEITVSMRHLSLRMSPIQSDKYQCRIDTVISPDDGHMVARNM